MPKLYRGIWMFQGWTAGTIACRRVDGTNLAVERRNANFCGDCRETGPRHRDTIDRRPLRLDSRTVSRRLAFSARYTRGLHGRDFTGRCATRVGLKLWRGLPKKLCVAETVAPRNRRPLCSVWRS